MSNIKRNKKTGKWSGRVYYLTIHSLRHSHCSVLIYKEISTHYISKRLGHKNVIETLKTYSHIIDEMEQKQDEKIVDVLQSFST
jgi:integrase